MLSPASMADRTMIGRSARALISRARVRPSMRGISRSMISRSGQPWSSRRSASSPSRAVVTSKPSCGAARRAARAGPGRRRRAGSAVRRARVARRAAAEHGREYRAARGRLRAPDRRSGNDRGGPGCRGSLTCQVVVSLPALMLYSIFHQPSSSVMSPGGLQARRCRSSTGVGMMIVIHEIVV